MKTTIIKTLIITVLLSTFLMIGCDPDWNKKAPVTETPKTPSGNDNPNNNPDPSDILTSLPGGFINGVEGNDVTIGDGIICFFGAQDKFYTSSDAGKTWITTKSFAYDMAISKGIIYAAFSDCVKMSSDKGKTWTIMENIKIAEGWKCESVEASSNYIVFGLYNTKEKKVVYSKDGGTTWIEAAIAFEQIGIESLYISGNRLILSIEEDKFRYADLTSNSLSVTETTVDSLLNALRFFVSGNTLCILTSNMTGKNILLYSSDSGTTWKSSTLTTTNATACAFYQNKLFYTANNDGINISYDNGAKWNNDLNFPFTIGMIYGLKCYKNIMIVCSGGEKPYVYDLSKEIESDEISSLQTGFLADSALLLFTSNDTIMLSLGTGFTITKDDGKTWYTNSSDEYKDCYFGATISNAIIYAATPFGAQYSSDYGKTWQALTNLGINPDIENITNVSGNDNYIIYLGDGKNGQFFIISKDYGKNWERYTPPLNIAYNIFNFITEGRYFYSNEGKIEFIDMQSDSKNPVKVLPNFFCDSFTGKNNELFAKGTDESNNAVIYYSKDTGDTWTKNEGITGVTDPDRIWGLAYKKGKLFCTSNKDDQRLFVSIDLGKTWTPAPNCKDSKIPSQYKQVYKNILICTGMGDIPYLYRIE